MQSMRPRRGGTCEMQSMRPRGRGTCEMQSMRPRGGGTCEMQSMRDAHTHTPCTLHIHSLIIGSTASFAGSSCNAPSGRCGRCARCPCGDGVCGLSASRVGSGRPGKYPAAPEYSAELILKFKGVAPRTTGKGKCHDKGEMLIGRSCCTGTLRAVRLLTSTL